MKIDSKRIITTEREYKEYQALEYIIRWATTTFCDTSENIISFAEPEECEKVRKTWALWAPRFTGDIKKDFRTLIDITKKEHLYANVEIEGAVNLFESDMECFDDFEKKYHIKPSYSIGDGDYYYDDSQDDMWSELCYCFDTTVRPILCQMWYFNKVKGDLKDE